MFSLTLFCLLLHTILQQTVFSSKIPAFALPAHLPMFSKDLSKSPFRRLSLMCALLLQATCVFLTSSVIALIWKKSLFNIQGVQLVRKNVRMRELNDISSTWLSKMDEYFRVGFFFSPFFFSFKRRLVVSEDKTCGGPLSTMEPIVWCVFTCDTAESITNC